MRRLIIGGVATLAIVGSLVFLYSRGGIFPPTIKPDPYVGVGQVVAQETAKLIEDHGRIGVVIADYFQDKDNPLANEWNAFREELRKHPSIELAATEVIPLGEMTPETAVSHGRFRELVQKHGELRCLVFFVGLPVWDAKKQFDLPPQFPKIVATPGPRRSLKQYFTSGVVSVLIVPRLAGFNPNLKPKTPCEWFDMLYEVYTTQNFDSLPDE